MKRLIPFVVLFVCATVFLSCTQEILFRDPAVTATKDGSYWQSTNTRVYSKKENNFTYYFIEAINGSDVVTLRTTGLTPQKYSFVNNQSKIGSLQIKIGEEIINYNTVNKKATGFVQITKYDKEMNTISGKFEFEAIKTDNDTLIYPAKVKFTNGHFLNVPIY